MSKLIKPDLVLLAKNIEIEKFASGRQVIDEKIDMVDWQMGRVDQDYKFYDIIPVADLNYDGDWRQLMPVVSKMYLLVEYQLKGSKFEELLHHVKNVLITGEIEKAFPEVVIFVEFYNKRQNGNS